MHSRRPEAVAVLLLLLTTFAAAQSAPRLPYITGNEVINVLLEANGTVKTWGDPWRLDLSPSLGDGKKPAPDVAKELPTALPGVSGIIDVAVGPTQVLLLRSDGTVLAWGGNDGCEVVGREAKSSYAPVQVPGVRGAKKVFAGYLQSAAILEDGSVMMWGDLENTPVQEDCAAPTRVPSLTNVTKLFLDTNSMALLGDGTVLTWGKNERGELCDGTKTKRAAAQTISGLSGVVDVAGGNASYFLMLDGTVKTCGGIHPTPATVPGIAKAKSLRAGNGTYWVTLADNTILGWGNGYHGALGNGHGDTENGRPSPPKGLGPVVAHYLSGGVSYALKPDGTVLQWGIIAPEGHRSPDGRKTEFYLVPEPAPFKLSLGN